MVRWEIAVAYLGTELLLLYIWCKLLFLNRMKPAPKKRPSREKILHTDRYPFDGSPGDWYNL